MYLVNEFEALKINLIPSYFLISFGHSVEIDMLMNILFAYVKI